MFLTARKFVDSTIRVLPSHRPRGSPSHWRTLASAWGRSMGMMRALWIISLWMTT